LLLCAGKAAAQDHTLQVVPVQGLSFGNLIPGVPEQVGVADGARRAEVVLQGRGTYDLSLILPAALVSPSGARIPLRFGTADAALASTTSTVPAGFNPRQMHRVRLGEGLGLPRLLLGGTALPAADQPPGRYQATLVLMVTPPGT
jgi:hypothetical protein